MSCLASHILYAMEGNVVLQCDKHMENGNHFDAVYSIQWREPFEQSTVPAKVPPSVPPKYMWAGKHDPRVKVVMNSE